MRLVMNAIFYVLRTGCAWRYLPPDFPPWQTVYSFYYRYRNQGVWEHVLTILRQDFRRTIGRDPEPSGAVMDSQSSKTTEQGGPRGFDGAKKVRGRKRHILVDSVGLLLRIVVHPADIQDRDGGKLLLDGIRGVLPRLEHIWADQGYTGAFQAWVEREQGVKLEVVYPWWRQIKRYDPELFAQLELSSTFNVLPRRWVVERTLAWLGRNRRLSKDYERQERTTEALFCLGVIRPLLRRLKAAHGRSGLVGQASLPLE